MSTPLLVGSMSLNQVHTPDSKLRFSQIAKVALGTSILTILTSLTGVFQSPEWSLWDKYFIWRSYEVQDPNIVIVTIGEEDANELGAWPISDQLLADLIKKVDEQEPRVIGLNLFRNLPIDNGKEELDEVFSSMPHLIGTKKAVGTEVAAPEILEEKGQIGFSDLVIDPDGVVRRALISVRSKNGEGAEASFATQIALNYLKEDDIIVEPEPPPLRLPFFGFNDREYLRLGKVRFRPLESNDGSYVRVDNGGYQLLLNYRGGGSQNFYTVSMRALMKGEIPAELVQNVNQPPLKDRIVLIGITADGNGTTLFTPYNRAGGSRNNGSGEQGEATPGVFIHAHIISQLIQGATEGRAFFKVLPQQGEWFWIFAWAIAGASSRWLVLNIRSLSQQVAIQNIFVVTGLGVGSIVIVTCSYTAFVFGWWIPAVPAICGFVAASLIMGSYHNYEVQKLATLDALTQVANRRYFDEYLYQAWWKCEKEQKPLSLIMCDIDHFKLYNDFYGHQVGDRCLKQVVNSIQQSLRDSDLVARYGGEEFIIVLPNTDELGAAHVAERICKKVAELKVEHEKSLTSPFVTVSCGVSSVTAHSQLSPVELIASADRALYVAKAEGRNQAIYQPYQNLPPLK
ncbi:CHASE2 domain-containing protein [[Leptolyngbya] sp. PCC 7376]|uniref:CHASE2 domain-containing protein n=1 Tax=[Leptolyngbya] sp. PCC 7376 TaxID=111781 RepID=UPI000688E94E|nr:CHASE2 domain-containing protein [[Leptolyngbya] sp. PCC 7376]